MGGSPPPPPPAAQGQGAKRANFTTVLHQGPHNKATSTTKPSPAPVSKSRPPLLSATTKPPPATAKKAAVMRAQWTGLATATTADAVADAADAAAAAAAAAAPPVAGGTMEEIKALVKVRES